MGALILPLNLDSYLRPYTKIILKWIIGLDNILYFNNRSRESRITIFIIGIPKERVREDYIFKNRNQKNFSSFHTHTHTQKPPWSYIFEIVNCMVVKTVPEESTIRHIIIKLPNCKEIDRILWWAGIKNQITYRDKKI